jgi:hypothetical protein
LNISGRSRKPQIKMAEQFGIRDYPCPAGGCLLTDPGFARRMRDLMAHRPDFSLNDVHLLKFGRHFRLSPSIKLVVGRNEDDNQKIQAFSQDGDLLEPWVLVRFSEGKFMRIERRQPLRFVTARLGICNGSSVSRVRRCG